MESKKEKLFVNNYIIFKHGSECMEGRIKAITTENGIESYQVLSLFSFSDVKVNAQDILTNVSQEVKRKMKSTAYQEIPNNTYFPQILKNVLMVDKEWTFENKYELPQKNNVSSVLKAFKEYICTVACLCDVDEAGEATKGMQLCFNTLFKQCLLYQNESEQMASFKIEPAEYCGPVHLLRLLYYLQKNIANLVSDESMRCIVLDYTIYLLDFLLYKYKEYF